MIIAKKNMNVFIIFFKLKDMLITLRENATLMHKELLKNPHVRIGGDEISPIKHLYLSDPCEIRELSCKKLESISDYVR